MGGKWKCEGFLPPIFGDPGGQIIDVLPPISRDPGGQINVFAPHHGGQMSPPQAENFGISISKLSNSLWENVFHAIDLGYGCKKFPPAAGSKKTYYC